MRLLENADILVENYKVGELSSYGLAYDQIKESRSGQAKQPDK